VAYSSQVIHEKLGQKFGATLGDKLFLLYAANPMVGVIDGFRWAILGSSGAAGAPSPKAVGHAAGFYWPGFSLSVGLTTALLIIGIYYFRKTERAFADVI
jgi:lipopolysaccharide transport system permease protein